MRILPIVLAAGLTLTPVLSRGAPPDDAIAVVRETLTAAREIVDTEGTRDEKLVSLRSLAAAMLNTRAMGRHALGDVLGEQPPEKQEEYLELFGHVMVRAYLSKLLLFRKPRFGYRKPYEKDGAVMVETKIITPKDEYHVDYAMKQHEGRWLATDVIVENISLSENYREQFASLLRNRTFEELLDLMRRKTQRVREEPT